MLIWGVLSGVIFICAQFLPISWIYQAIFWSIMTVFGAVTMSLLTYSWSVSEKIAKVVYLWAFLMITGVIVTDYAIVSGWSFVLVHLCDLWLILSAIGYAITGWLLRSRAFFLAAIIHSLTIFVLPYLGTWQFLSTGLVMMNNLLLFSERQWDMLLPREVTNYSEQKITNCSLPYYLHHKYHYRNKLFRNPITKFK